MKFFSSIAITTAVLTVLLAAPGNHVHAAEDDESKAMLRSRNKSLGDDLERELPAVAPPPPAGTCSWVYYYWDGAWYCESTGGSLLCSVAGAAGSCRSGGRVGGRVPGGIFSSPPATPCTCVCPPPPATPRGPPKSVSVSVAPLP